MAMDASEVGELYRRFGPLIYRRCRRLLVDDERAVDASQEVFVRAVRHAENLTSDRECLPWLYRVSTNYCLNLIREEKKSALFALSDAAHRSEEWECGIERTFFARREVERLLCRFDDTDAQIAVYAYLDRMTQEEIAEVTGLSRKTVGKRLKQIAEAAKENRALCQEADL
jgi:RNA polymerase sigma-70 factor (ECF subfamily)